MPLLNDHIDDVGEEDEDVGDDSDDEYEVVDDDDSGDECVERT